MSKLPLPLKRSLRDAAPDAARIDRLWSVTRARIAPRRRVALLALSVATAIGLVLLGLRLRAPSPGPLSLADGRPLGAMMAETPRAILLADGSRLELESGAALEPMSNDAAELALMLRRGRIRVELAPRQARRWTLDAGLASILATEARFAVYRDESAVAVTVYAGTLVVRGEHVAGGLRRLGAGDELRVTAPSTAASSTAAAETVLPPRLPSARPRREDWRALARGSRFDAAYDALGAAGIRTVARTTLSMDELLLVADVARLSGHPGDALPALARAAREFPEDRRAGLAAYTAGRLQADELHQPGRAAEAFAEAIHLGLPQALDETAYLRLVEIRAASGDRAGALETARRYDAHFPGGHFHARMQALLGNR